MTDKANPRWGYALLCWMVVFGLGFVTGNGSDMWFTLMAAVCQ